MIAVFKIPKGTEEMIEEEMTKKEVRILLRAAFTDSEHDAQKVAEILFSIGTCCGSCRFSVRPQGDLLCTKRYHYRVRTFWVCKRFEVDQDAPVYSTLGRYER